jgi:hypothetical protein
MFGHVWQRKRNYGYAHSCKHPSVNPQRTFHGWISNPHRFVLIPSKNDIKKASENAGFSMQRRREMNTTLTLLFFDILEAAIQLAHQFAHHFF